MSSRENKRIETKNKIIEVAFALFSEKSIRNVSTQEIANQVGVTKGNIFYHFKTKENLASEVLKMIFESMYDIFVDLNNKIMKNPERYDIIFREFFEEVYKIENENPNLITFALDYISEFYINKPDSQLIHTFLEDFNKFNKVLIDIFHILSIPNPEVKIMILFSILEGVGIQLSYLPLENITHVLIDEIISIIKYWNHGDDTK